MSCHQEDCDADRIDAFYAIVINDGCLPLSPFAADVVNMYIRKLQDGADLTCRHDETATLNPYSSTAQVFNRLT